MFSVLITSLHLGTTMWKVAVGDIPADAEDAKQSTAEYS